MLKERLPLMFQRLAPKTNDRGLADLAGFEPGNTHFKNRV
jgi:hypothetical protein